MNDPYSKVQSIVRNTCPIINVNNKLMETTIACPPDRTSIGRISLGTNHPNGPHDHANPETNRHIITSTQVPYDAERTLAPPNWVPKIQAITICKNHNNKVLKTYVEIIKCS
jgi:hypothetical protein